MNRYIEVAQNIYKCALEDNNIILELDHDNIEEIACYLLEHYDSMLEEFNNEEFNNRVYTELEQIIYNSIN